MSEPLPMNADARVRGGTSEDGEALLWWRQTPPHAAGRVGAIGGFRASNEAAAAEVLARACERLLSEGCRIAIGPMDGNTWRRYRFVTDPGTEPPFLLEPTNPPEWPEWWRGDGFAPLAEYYSSATAHLAERDPRVANVAARLAADGVTVRAFDPAHFEDELARIHEVSVVSFRDNFLYTELPRAEFLAQYRALQTRIRPELVWLAEHGGQAVGYVFAVPDYLQAQRGEPLTSIIVKTLAVLPGRAHAGLGAWLLDRVHAEAHRLGYTRAIHALMHESNKSRNLSARSAETIRRYALFARTL